mgnify:FL=1|jgi:hypothetical protein
MSSGIHRIYKTESVKFTALPNWVVRDPKYTANTFRFLAYLLSHEDGYEITYDQIERETGLGRWAINQASQILSQFGWIEVSRPVANNGRFLSKSWIIKDPTSVDRSTMEPPHLGPFHYGMTNGLKENKDLKKTNNLRKQKEQPSVSSFDEFWDVYPRKVDKAKALKAFDKALQVSEFQDILAGTISYRDDANRLDQFTKYPATWLNAESWNNDPLPHDPRAEKERDLIEQDRIKKEWGQL